MMLPHEAKLYATIQEMIRDGYGAELEQLAALLNAETCKDLRRIAEEEFAALRVAHDLLERVARH
jgi:hypothetical protein